MLILRFDKITFNRLFNQSLWSLKDKLEVSIRKLKSKKGNVHALPNTNDND